MKARKFAATVALSALALSACGGQDLIAQSDNTAQSGPVIDAQRVEGFLTAIQSDITAADEAHNVELLADRLVNPALRLRQAQYTVAKATNATLPELNVGAGNIAVTDTQTWPRTVVNIAKNGDSPVPSTYFFTQENARAPYKLHSWARVMGGTTLTIPAIKVGSATISGDSEGFLVTPAQAIAGYAEMLNAGAAGNDSYTADEFATVYLQDVKTLNDAVQSAGSVKAAASVADTPITGVVLEDGSALVSASLTYTLTYARTVARSTMRLGGTTAAVLAGEDDSVKGTATANYIATIVLRIPVAGTEGKVEVVAAERSLESVTLDDSSNPDNAN